MPLLTELLLRRKANTCHFDDVKLKHRERPHEQSYVNHTADWSNTRLFVQPKNFTELPVVERIKRYYTRLKWTCKSPCLYCKPPNRLDQLSRVLLCKKAYVITVAYDDAFTKDSFSSVILHRRKQTNRPTTVYSKQTCLQYVGHLVWKLTRL